VVTVEFALMLPLLVIFLVGIVEFGHIWYLKHTLNNASREGARYGVRNSDNLGNLETVVKNSLTSAYFEKYDVLVAVDPDPSTPGSTGDPLTVELTARQNVSILIGPLLELAGYGGGDTLSSISSQTTMIFE
jgi:Flp pilus assembly protein TadG